MSTGSDQDGFKVPSLPISKAKPLEDIKKNETPQQEAEQASKLDDTVTTHTEDKLSEIENEQAKPPSEGNLSFAVILPNLVPTGLTTLYIIWSILYM